MESNELNLFTERELRSLLINKFGPRNYRITANDEVHVYGPMPSANHITGWYLLGGKFNILRRLRDEYY